MPWSSPSTSPGALDPPPIEVLDPEHAPRPERVGSGKPALALIGVVAVFGLALNLLPERPGPTSPVEATLPAPISATSLPDRDRTTLALISDETLPLRLVPSLAGYATLVGPAPNAKGGWWMIGTTIEPTLLSSADGIEWQVAGSFPATPGISVRVSSLIANDGVLLAAGRARVNDDPRPSSRLQTWRSADGALWVPDLVAIGPAFSNIDVVADGTSVLVSATDGNGHDWIYRSTSFSHWEDATFTSSFREIVRAPKGGFMASTGTGEVYTSAYGVNWNRNNAIESGFYTQWGGGVLGLTADGEGELLIITPEGRDRISLPADLRGCDFEAGPRGFLAICRRTTPTRFDLYTSPDGSQWKRAQAELLTDTLTYIGASDAGFFVSTPDSKRNLVVSQIGS